MKLLITGATGLVGNSLIEKLTHQGIQIHYLTTRKSQMKSIQEAQGYYWNPNKKEIDLACFLGVDGIIHLAGATVSKRWTKAYKEKIHSSRVLSTQLLLKGLQSCKGDHQIKQLVSASAIGIYPSDFKKIMNEEMAIEPTAFMQKVVYDWEGEVDAFKAEGVTVAKIRIGLVLSKKGGVLGTLKIPVYFGLGAAFGNGKQGQSWIHMDDLVGIFSTAIDQKWEGVYNAVAPNSVNQSRLIAALSRALKRPYFLPPIPALFIKLGAGEMSDLVLDSHWVSTQKVLDQGYKFQFTDIEKAIDDLLG
jgi:uncharacterized protein (TIGR01777 family)